MAALNITIPDPLWAFVEAQAEKEGFGSASEYVQSVIREAQARQARRVVDEKLREGLASGPAEPMTREDWDDLERKVRQRGELGREVS